MRRSRANTAWPAVSLPWIEPDHEHPDRARARRAGAQRPVLGGVPEHERGGGGGQGQHPPHGSVQRRMDSVVVVGAGTFGASLAWWLARDGVAVTLVDQFEPGDRRATSGGETRLIRCSHGDDPGYTASARRARTLWRELEAETGADLLIECGVIWFAHREDGWEAASERTLRAQGIPVERLGVDEAARLFPSFRGDDLVFLLHEPEAGVLRAQRAVQALAAQAQAHGARVVRGRARPTARASWSAAPASRRTPWSGRAAAGSPSSSPGLVSLPRRGRTCSSSTAASRGRARPAGSTTTLRSTAPATSTGSASRARPTSRARRWRPTPSCPRPTPPTSAGPRLPRPPLPRARRRAAQGLATCRYELSPDSHFIAAPHPEHPGVWLLGGGSGHGFKHGPAMAEAMAAALRGGEPLPARYRLGERAVGRSMRTSGSGR